MKCNNCNTDMIEIEKNKKINININALVKLKRNIVVSNGKAYVCKNCSQKPNYI